MLRQIFLGKIWQWAMLLVVAGLLWWTGTAKMHVIHFNTFVSLLLIGSAVVVLLVVQTTKPGEQVTRDKLRDDADDSVVDGD